MTERTDSEEAALRSYTAEMRGEGPLLSWEDILSSRVVVMLGEPGSGKTWELKNRSKLSQEKGFSFFIHLDRLVESDIENSLISDDKSQFEEWKGGGGEALFFFDSVDEAKFRKPQDFATALNRFVLGIGPENILHIRLVISARISEWNFFADRNELIQRFGIKHKTSENKDKTDEKADFRVVQLEPLDKSRIRKFVEEYGIQNPDSFIQALDFHYAWDFARRPIDIADLINYWKENEKLGTLTELIEYSIDNNLKENPERAQNDPLSPQLARIGAECLGAATIFCRRFNFLVPDTIPSDEKDGAMKAEECLPTDWEPNKYKAILNRPIFDVASYGQIRFHHRRISEYLAASWINNRLQENCPYPVIEEILFSQGNECIVVRSSFRPVAAWLAIGSNPWNEKIRNKIMSCSPDLFFSHGDPASLPIEFRLSLLKYLVERYKSRSRIYVDTQDDALSRIADSELATDISELLIDTATSNGIKRLLLQMIRHGRLIDCVDDVLKIVESSSETDELKTYAVATIRDIGDQQAKSKLFSIVQNFDLIEAYLCGLICEAIYPYATDANGLSNILSKSSKVERYSVSLNYHLKTLLKTSLLEEHIAELLKELLKLSQKEPRIIATGRDTPISDQFYWLGEVIPIVLIRLLTAPHVLINEINLAAKAIWLLVQFDRYGRIDRDFSEELSPIINKLPQARRAYVWICVDKMRKYRPEREPSLFSVFTFNGIIQPCESDIDWLVQDIQENSSQNKKEIALKLAVNIWHYFGRKAVYKNRIKRSIKSNAELKNIFLKEAKFNTVDRIKSFLARYGIHDKENTKFRIKIWCEEFIAEFKFKKWLLFNLKGLRNGSEVNALYWLSEEAKEDHLQYGDADKEILKTKRSVLVVNAVVEGWKNSWRQWEPPLPHEKPNANETEYKAIIGLCGINISISDGDIETTSMTADEVRLACRYAVNETNGFPAWLNDLTEYHTDLVREVLINCIDGEWEIPADQEFIPGVLNTIRYHAQDFSSFVADDIIKILESKEPLNYKILETALEIILSDSPKYQAPISNLAVNRLGQHNNEDPRFIVWMIICFQLNSSVALKKLEENLSQAQEPSELMIDICTGLRMGSDRGLLLVEKPDYLNVTVLKKFIPLVFSQINLEDDFERNREGVTVVTPRKRAQEFRDGLLEQLSYISDAGAEDLLQSFATDPMFGKYRDYILHLAEKRAVNFSDAIEWKPKDIQEFMREHECNPHSNYELYKLACKRFVTIKNDVEKGEISSRYDLHIDDDESKLRSWLARQLKSLSKDRYTVSQEVEIDLKQKPDLRIDTPGLEPVSIEIKWADNWSLNQLEDGLVNQLVGQYLRAPNTNYGIYVLGLKGKEDSWKARDRGLQLSFSELVQHIKAIAKDIEMVNDNVLGLTVFSINFTTPSTS